MTAKHPSRSGILLKEKYKNPLAQLPKFSSQQLGIKLVCGFCGSVPLHHGRIWRQNIEWKIGVDFAKDQFKCYCSPLRISPPTTPLIYHLSIISIKASTSEFVRVFCTQTKKVRMMRGINLVCMPLCSLYSKVQSSSVPFVCRGKDSGFRIRKY